MKIKFFFAIMLLLFMQTQIPLSQKEVFEIFSLCIDQKKLKNITLSISKKNELFFLDNPEKYFPLSEKKLGEFILICQPINDFFYPQKWGMEIFCEPLDDISEELNQAFIKSYVIDKKRLEQSEVIVLTYPEYSDLKFFFTEYRDVIESGTKKIFIKTNQEKYTYTQEESDKIISTIIKDIEYKNNKKLGTKEIDFIKKNVNTNYGICSILMNFFNYKNYITLFNDSGEMLLSDFVYYLDINNISSSTISFISFKEGSCYEELEYLLDKKEFSELYDNNKNIYFFNINYDTNDSEKNIPNDINAKKLRSIFLCIDMIGNYLDY